MAALEVGKLANLEPHLEAKMEYNQRCNIKCYKLYWEIIIVDI